MSSAADVLDLGVGRPVPRQASLAANRELPGLVIDLTEASGRRLFEHDVAVVGLGYVGLPTALGFHAAGCTVLGVDASVDRLSAIRAGRVDLIDADRQRLTAATGSGQLQLTMSPDALQLAETVIVCVPTPVDEHLVPDLTLLRAACAQVVANARAGQTLILTSTTYVGSTDDLLVRPLAERGLIAGEHIHVAFSPERINPGDNTYAQSSTARVVGGFTTKCTMRAVASLSRYTNNLHAVSSPRAAEMSKLIENTFRAVNVALANEFADISAALDLDITEVLTAAATKPYGFMAFRPGPGVGGHCIPCDPHYLIWQMRRARVSTPVIEQAMNGIALRPRRVCDRAQDGLAQSGIPLSGARVLVVGVAYKPDVEDIRESPAIEILQRLLDAGADARYWDPLVPTLALPGGHVLTSVSEPCHTDTDLVIVHTVHRDLDLEWLRDRLVLDASFSLSDLTNKVVL